MRARLQLALTTMGTAQCAPARRGLRCAGGDVAPLRHAVGAAKLEEYRLRVVFGAAVGAVVEKAKGANSTLA